MINKICQVCNFNKPISEFYFRKETNSFMSHCKKCWGQKTKLRAEAHKEEVKIQKKIWYETNKDEINRKRRIYYEENDEYKCNILLINKQYRDNHKEEISLTKKIWYENNKEEVLTQQKNYNNIKRKTDVSFRLRQLVSRSIWGALKSNGNRKNGSILDFLPYSIEDLKLYIERLFSHPDNLILDGGVWMTWSNHGQYRPTRWHDNDPSTWTWQLDHIIPHSNFRYETMDCQEFKDCWALSNLRPLSAKQNVIDGSHRLQHDNTNKTTY